MHSRALGAFPVSLAGLNAIWYADAAWFATIFFSARQHIRYALARYMLSPVRLSVRLSVCLSVTWVDQSKTIEIRIVQLAPQGSPMTLVFPCRTAPRNSKGKRGAK